MRPARQPNVHNRIRIPVICLLLSLLGLAPIGCASRPQISSPEKKPAVRVISSVETPPEGFRFTPPREIRIFRGQNLTGTSRKSQKFSFLRVTEKVSKSSEIRQLFEICHVHTKEKIRTDLDIKSLDVTCRTLGSDKGYTTELLADVLEQSLGQHVGLDWDKFKVSLSNCGIAAGGAALFFVLDPSKMMGFTFGLIAISQGGAAIYEARRSNILDPGVAPLLKLNALQPGLTVVTSDINIEEQARIVNITLRRIDRGENSRFPEPSEPLPPDGFIDLVPMAAP